MIPKDFAPWESVYYYFSKWKNEGVIEELLDNIRSQVRTMSGREESPCLGIIDSRSGTTLANYSYLADGTKLEAVDGSGGGLVYRGPFVYRKSPGGSSLTLESVAFGGGRLAAGRDAGYFVGGVTNVVPGTGFIRDWYSPDNSVDYNSALKRTDEAAAVMGTVMMKAGTGTMAAGGVLATANVGVVVNIGELYL